MVGKRGLGLVKQGGKVMLWGKGAIAGDFVFLSGAEGRSDEDDWPLEGIKAQTELALDRIDQRLAEAGTSFNNIVKVVNYLQDRGVRDEFFAVRDAWLERNYPALLRERSYAATLLYVGLDLPEMLVEIDCIAYVPPP